MADEEEDRLNFYSKYNRVKDRQDIDTLYTLIDNNKPAQIHIVNVSLMREEREKRAQSELKHKNSKPIIPKQILGKQNDENHEEEYDQLNDKLEKLKRLERQFHQEMDRRERNLKKKRQQKQQQRRQQQKYKDQLINVVDLKPSNASSLKSSQLKSKKNGSVMQEVVVDNQELDFEDYYREVPEVPIYSSYISNTSNKKQVRQKLEQHRNREKYVESVDQEGDRRADSIVIGRMNLGNKNTNKNEVQGQPQKYVEVQLTHSQSLNVFAEKRFDKKQFESDQNEILERKASHQLKQSIVQDYSPARHLNSIEQNIYMNGTDENKQNIEQLQQKDQLQIDNQHQQDRNCEEQDPYQEEQKQEDVEIQQQIHEDYVTDHKNLAYLNNYTGTQQGESVREQFEDRVGPIMNKSEYRQQNYNVSVQPTVFHSQTLPNSKIHIPREVQSVASESLDYHPLQSPSDELARQKSFQNKKSSFKKLMAENRANLVPRMAISTILNEHINEALIPIAQPALTLLHKSIINTQSPAPLSPPSKKKRVNFKQKIVEQELNKSYSREGRPAFERNQQKVQKNKGLLLNFFAQN